jgi:ATP-dependent Clp protease ATP-binding subunit ClpC
LAKRFERPEAGAWARFTAPARQVIFLSQEEATALGENFVGTEHLLLGLIRIPDSVGARILTGMGISLENIRGEVLRQITRQDRERAQEMLLTPQAKTVIDLAYAEAWGYHDYYLRDEHLLIGMLKETSGLAAQVLVKLGASLERARAELRSLQAA